MEIIKYLDYLSNAFIINKVARYDIHGKKLFELSDKYYFEDLGLRNKIIGGNRRADIEKVIENAVYLHLKHLGYTVNVGQFMKTEIEFCCRKKRKNDLYPSHVYAYESRNYRQRIWKSQNDKK